MIYQTYRRNNKKGLELKEKKEYKKIWINKIYTGTILLIYSYLLNFYINYL